MNNDSLANIWDKDKQTRHPDNDNLPGLQSRILYPEYFPLVVNISYNAGCDATLEGMQVVYIAPFRALPRLRF